MAPDPQQWVWCRLREVAPQEGHSAKPPPDAHRPRQLPGSTVRPPTARAYSCCIFMPTTGRGAGTRPSPPGHLRGLLPSAPEDHRSFQCASSSAARGTE